MVAGRFIDDTLARIALRRRREKDAALHKVLEHCRWNRIGLGVVADVSVEAVHDIEARVPEKLLERRTFDRLVDLGLEKWREVGIDRQRFDRRQVGVSGLGGN